MASKQNEVGNNSQHDIDDTDLITVDERNEEDASNMHSSSSVLQTIDQWNESDENVEWNLADEWAGIDQIGAGIDFPPEHFYELHHPQRFRIRRYNTEGLEYRISFRNIEDMQNLQESIVNVLYHATNHIISTSEYNDMVGASFSHPDLEKPVLVHFRPRNVLNREIIVREIERILQSKDSVKIDDRQATLRITTVSQPKGAGRPRLIKLESTKTLIGIILDKVLVV